MWIRTTSDFRGLVVVFFKESNKVAEAQWPENGDAWSEAEDDAGMDCELLQAMAEEDEDINVFNEETFGMGESIRNSCINNALNKTL